MKLKRLVTAVVVLFCTVSLFAQEAEAAKGASETEVTAEKTEKSRKEKKSKKAEKAEAPKKEKASKAEKADRVSEEKAASDEEGFLGVKNLSVRTAADLAYYPKSDYVAGGDHFAPVTGAFSGLEARVTGWADYVIPTPLGDHWLLKDANVKVSGGLEITPIAATAMLQGYFTPVPFFVLGAGASFGAGWNLGPVSGLKMLWQEDREYRSLTTFKNNFYDLWLQGTFQFDTGAIWKGDWTHVLLQASYKTYYEGLTFTSDEAVWTWKNAMNKANGWQWAASGIIAYQMPIIVNRAGVIAEFSGHYNSSDYKNFSSWGGNFTTIDINPFAQCELTKNDSLTALICFRARRSFEEDHTSEVDEPYLTYSGNEWFFRRVAFSWTHKF